MELPGTVTERSHPGNNKRRAPYGVMFCMDEATGSAHLLQGMPDAAEISTAVVDQTDERIPSETHSTPFVLGIPFTRSSCDTATSRALPSALKMASAM